MTFTKGERGSVQSPARTFSLTLAEAKRHLDQLPGLSSVSAIDWRQELRRVGDATVSPNVTATLSLQVPLPSSGCLIDRAGLPFSAASNFGRRANAFEALCLGHCQASHRGTQARQAMTKSLLWMTGCAAMPRVAKWIGTNAPPLPSWS